MALAGRGSPRSPAMATDIQQGFPLTVCNSLHPVTPLVFAVTAYAPCTTGSRTEGAQVKQWLQFSHVILPLNSKWHECIFPWRAPSFPMTMELRKVWSQNSQSNIPSYQQWAGLLKDYGLGSLINTLINNTYLEQLIAREQTKYNVFLLI